MKVLNIVASGANHQYEWPSGNVEDYPVWVDYEVVSEGRVYIVKVGFGTRYVFERDRRRVVVWIDDKPEVEFFGVDDFEETGDLITDIRVQGNKYSRYPSDRIPEPYKAFEVVGMPTRVSGKRVRSSWAVLTGTADHRTMIEMAFLRRRQRG